MARQDIGENAATGIHGAVARRCRDRGLQVVAADCEALCRLEGVENTVADMNRPLPFADGDFDAVVSIEGIEHIERPFDFVRECHRVLRPGGAVVLTTPNISALRSRWRWLLTGFHNKCKSPLDETRPNPLHHINMISFPEIRYMLHTSGFRIADIRTNRIKGASLLYAPLAPLTWLVSRVVLEREEGDPDQRRRNREVLAQMHRRALLFGEIMIVAAEKVAAPA
jgi:SAM-dependent methyltransferase